MVCPVCGRKTKVIAVVNNKKQKEQYRKRRCTNRKCWSHFYTVEFKVDVNDRFMKDWKDNDKNNL